MWLVFFTSLGCSKNTSDTEKIIKNLPEAFSITVDPLKADAIVINTCAFIQPAVEESIETILDAIDVKKKNGAKIFVTGCFVNRFKDEEIELTEVDEWIFIEKQEMIGEYLKNYYSTISEKFVNKTKNNKPKKKIELSRIEEQNIAKYEYISEHLYTSPYFSYVKISDGCNRKCSYCIIPKIKGRMISRNQSLIVDEIKGKVNLNVKEINLVAQDLLSYGDDLEDNQNIINLINKLVLIQGLKWLRLLYLSFDRIGDDFLEVIKNNEKVCNYLDIPLQHCNYDILKMMNRNYYKFNLFDTISRWRALIPDLSIRTTFITGFPGETEKQHQELLEFIEKVKFDKLGVFCYQDEKEAFSFGYKGKISYSKKLRRMEDIMELQEEIVTKNNEKKIGKVINVLFEKYRDSLLIGRTEFDAPEVDYNISCDGNVDILGKIVKVKITGQNSNGLVGELF